MELFLLRHSDWERLYNCSGVEQQMALLYPMEKRTHPGAAWTVIALCAIYYALYIPCMFSIWRSAQNACYKLLFYIGVTDMAVLWVIGFYQGYLSLSGTFFCQSPMQIYLAGVIAQMIWIAESTADLILAINRCTDTVWPKLAKTLFDGKRVWIWMALSTAYALYGVTFWPTVVFIPMYFSQFFNPYTGLHPDSEGIYENRLHTVHNTVIVVVYPLAYAIFVVAFFVKMHKHQTGIQISKAEKMMFLQVLTISTLNAVAASIYVYMQHVSAPEWLIIVGQFALFHIHGLPPVIYLLLNRTIRQDCKAMLAKVPLASQWMKRLQGASTSTVVPVLPMDAVNPKQMSPGGNNNGPTIITHKV